MTLYRNDIKACGWSINWTASRAACHKVSERLWEKWSITSSLTLWIDEMWFSSTTCTPDLHSSCELIRFWVFNTNFKYSRWTFIFKVSNEYLWWVISIPVVLATGWYNVVSAWTVRMFYVWAENFISIFVEGCFSMVYSMAFRMYCISPLDTFTDSVVCDI